MPSAIDEASRVYAESLRELAAGAGGEAKEIEIGEELDALASLIEGNASFAAALRSPIVDTEKRAAFLRKVLASGFSDLVLRTLLVMNRRGRSAAIAGLPAAYRALLDERLGRVHVEVHTPGGPPLGEAMERLLRDRVREAFGKEAIISVRRDPRMLGGVRIRIGDRLLDGSVATRLRRLSDELVGRGGPEVRARFQAFVEDAGNGTAGIGTN